MASSGRCRGSRSRSACAASGATTRCLSFEEFSAGNYTAGRGYDPGTLLGDSGVGLQAELRFGSAVPTAPDQFRIEPYRLLRPGLGVERGPGVRAAPPGALFDRRRRPRRLWRPLPPRRADCRAARPRALSRPAAAIRACSSPSPPACGHGGPDDPAPRLDAELRPGRPVRSPGGPKPRLSTRNPTTIAGTVSYDRATPGVETITLDSSSAIIRWDPNVGGNPLVFLPAGRTATFINGISNSNFAVLNRIQANVPIRFDGTVISRLVDAGTGTSAPGGTVIFESPGGIIVGPKALFDVGNLILTTLTVATDGGGNFIDASGAFHFSGGAKAGVTVEPGGQILANTQGSYVGLIAPVIQQGGTVRVNGSVAYVAAEAVEFRANAGLFDIIVTAGSQNPIPLIHTGATGGPASTGAGDVHRIYMVAVPKNTAITAILQGNVGFDPAVVAGVENGAIVLSAGYSVVGGEPDRFADFTAGPVPDLQASFEIRGGTISSDLFGYAVTNMLASGSATGSLAFQQDVSLFGGVQAALFAGANQMVTVGGNALRLDRALPDDQAQPDRPCRRHRPDFRRRRRLGRHFRQRHRRFLGAGRGQRGDQHRRPRHRRHRRPVREQRRHRARARRHPGARDRRRRHARSLAQSRRQRPGRRRPRRRPQWRPGPARRHAGDGRERHRQPLERLGQSRRHRHRRRRPCRRDWAAARSTSPGRRR